MAHNEFRTKKGKLNKNHPKIEQKTIQWHDKEIKRNKKERGERESNTKSLTFHDRLCNLVNWKTSSSSSANTHHDQNPKINWQFYSEQISLKFRSEPKTFRQYKEIWQKTVKWVRWEYKHWSFIRMYIILFVYVVFFCDLSLSRRSVQKRDKF